jgi:hypothetical protein
MYLLEREVSSPAPPGALVHGPFVARRLDDIFSFRGRVVRESFAW